MFNDQKSLSEAMKLPQVIIMEPPPEPVAPIKTKTNKDIN